MSGSDSGEHDDNVQEVGIFSYYGHRGNRTFTVYGRHGLMASRLASRLSPGWGHCTVFLDKT